MADLPQLQPFDEHNQKLRSHVQPSDWKNPTPDGRYNLVIVGAGPAGLVTAAGAAGLGAKVALIERELMGGDCLNVGCVPSKALISAARAAAAVQTSSQFGIDAPQADSIDFSLVMDRMRRLRADMSHHDSVQRFTELGVDVYLGSGRFTGRSTIDVDGQELAFKRAVVCTGARAAEIPVPGLREAAPLTNETLFSLTTRPNRFVVIGGGPIGCEMAQSFANFGSDVTLIEQGPMILPREDPDAATIVQQAMERDGVRFVFQARTTRLENRGEKTVVHFQRDDREHELTADKVLLSTGRMPNVNNMGLEAAGVMFDERRGIAVNDRLQTSNSKIYAAGDVCSRYQFTHSADFQARIVIQNTLFFGRARAGALTVPWCTYTSPELAHVGLTPEDAAKQGISVDTYTVPFKEVDRAILEDETEGFVRAHVRRGTDEILGATIVASHAGDMIGEIALAITLDRRIPRWKKLLRLSRGVGLSAIGATIHPYPTQAEAIRRLGDQYNRTRLTPLVQRLLKRWLSWTR